MRRPVAAAAAFRLVGMVGIGPASAITGTGGLSGLGSAYSTTSEGSGYGSLTTAACVVGVTSDPSPEYARCTLEYDITSIPAEATVTAAFLGLHSAAVPACAERNCRFDVAGYVGDAVTSLADLTAGTPIEAGGPMGSGEEAVLNVTDFVRARHVAGDIIAGFRIGRNDLNPDNDRVTISHPTSENPPKLVIRYGFAQQLTIELAGTGQGRITSEPAGIDCPGDCSGTFIGTSTVFLDVEVLDGGTFDGWEPTSPCGGAEGGCKLRMPDNAITITASFSGATPPSSAPTASPSAAVTSGPATLPPVTSAPATAAASSSSGASPSAGSSSVATIEPSAAAVPSGTGALETIAPGESSTTTGSGGPVDPAAGTGGSMIIPLVLLIAMVVIGGVGFVTIRRRRAAAAVAGDAEPPVADI